MKSVVLAAALALLAACQTTREVRRYNHETRFGLYAPELLRPNERQAAAVAILLADGRAVHFTDAVLHRDGERVWVNKGGGPVLGEWAIGDVRAALIVERTTR